MDSVHNRNAGAVALAEDRGRDGRKPVVNVNDVRTKLVQYTRNSLAHVRRTGKLVRRRANAGQGAVNRIVVGIESLNLNVAPGKQAGLCVHHGVFSAALLVPIMDEQDLHAIPRNEKHLRPRRTGVI